jgi:hypothetical protein
MEEKGYGMETYPLRWLYRCVWAGQTLQGDLEGALKCLLRVGFEVCSLVVMVIQVSFG